MPWRMAPLNSASDSSSTLLMSCRCTSWMGMIAGMGGVPAAWADVGGIVYVDELVCPNEGVCTGGAARPDVVVVVCAGERVRCGGGEVEGGSCGGCSL